MANSIPAKDIVNVVPGVVSAGGTGLDMTGLILTESMRAPFGQVLSFPNARAVSEYFGPTSAEAAAATVYFNGYIGATSIPAFLLFAAHVLTARAGWIRGGTLGLTLDELKALTGTLTINFGGTGITSSTIVLTSATSFSNAATIIQAAFTSPDFAVTYDAIAGAFLFTSTATGDTATIVYSTGTLAAGLRLTEATGATLSQGADPQTATETMQTVADQTQNFVSFTHLDELTDDEIVDFATWNDAQDDRFLFVAWTDAAAAITNSDTTSPAVRIAALELSGTASIYAPTPDKAVFVLGYAGSIDFNRDNGRTVAAFRRGPGLRADVTNQTVANNLLANGYSFYGAYATANDDFVWLYNGTVSGPFAYIDSYLNQIWMNNAFQLSLMTLLGAVGQIPYNDDGYELIAAGITTDINNAVDFGAIRSGVVLSEQQRIIITGLAGQDITETLFTRGWELVIRDPGPTVRAERGSPICTFFFADGQSVQKITLNSLMVQ